MLLAAAMPFKKTENWVRMVTWQLCRFHFEDFNLFVTRWVLQQIWMPPSCCKFFCKGKETWNWCKNMFLFHALVFVDNYSFLVLILLWFFCHYCCCIFNFNIDPFMHRVHLLRMVGNIEIYVSEFIRLSLLCLIISSRFQPRTSGW